MPGMISSLKKSLSNTTQLILFPGDHSRFRRNVGRIRNFVLLVLLSIVLWFVTVRTRLDTSIRAPLLVLRPFWLVLLLWSTVITYLCIRRLVHLLRTEPIMTPFPEMEENWNYIKAALLESNVRPRDLPVIMVLGHRPLEGVHFFDNLQPRLRNIRLRTDSELLFQADLTDSAIIITCQNASSLGTLTRRLELSRTPSPGSVKRNSILGASKSTLTGVIGLSPEPQLPGETQTAMNNESQTTGFESGNRDDSAGEMLSDDEILLATAKLKYLCDLISAERYPLCPMNGAILVIPREMTDSDQLMTNAIELAKNDLDCIRLATGLHFPYAVLTSNMHHLRGFDELVKKLDSGSKHRYLGLALHTRLDIATDLWLKQIKKAMRWFRQRVMPALVLREMLEIPPSALSPQAASRGSLIRSNHSSFLFLQNAGRQWRNMENICIRLGEHQLKSVSSNPRFAGLFVTGLENNETGHWLFIHEFFKHMLSQQNSISWTPEALASDRKQKRLALFMLTVLLAITGAIVVIAIWNFMK